MNGTLEQLFRAGCGLLTAIVTILVAWHWLQGGPASVSLATFAGTVVWRLVGDVLEGEPLDWAWAIVTGIVTGAVAGLTLQLLVRVAEPAE